MQQRSEDEEGEPTITSAATDYIVINKEFDALGQGLFWEDPVANGVPLYGGDLETLIVDKTRYPTEQGRLWPGDIVSRLSQDYYLGGTKHMRFGEYKVKSAKDNALVGKTGYVYLKALNEHWKIGDPAEIDWKGEWHAGKISKVPAGFTLNHDRSYTVDIDSDVRATSTRIRPIPKTVENANAEQTCAEYQCPYGIARQGQEEKAYSLQQNLDSTTFDEATCCVALNIEDRVAVKAAFSYVYKGKMGYGLVQKGATGTVKELRGSGADISWDESPVGTDVYEKMWIWRVLSKLHIASD